MFTQKRNIVLNIVLCFLTCFLWYPVWFIQIADDINDAEFDIREEKSYSGILVFLFNILTCGIYSYIWIYTAGKRLDNIKKNKSLDVEKSSLMYLILSLFGFQIIALALIQTELNKIAEFNISINKNFEQNLDFEVMQNFNTDKVENDEEENK